MLSQFNKLITELLKGTLSRNTFRPWEVDILLDIEHCNLRDGNKRETLRRYQKSVQRNMEKGAPEPMKLSEYLRNLQVKREQRATTRLEETALSSR
ncbi:MAG: hypothetical protein HY820_22265 [Acidobacteria bacterium]|nr:hypothetical protein [Acidobacteriota bacterium]